MTSNRAFLEALARDMPDDARLVLCWFEGDPGAEAALDRWRPRPWTFGKALPSKPYELNTYVAVSAFNRNERGEYRRKASQFAAGLAVMIDDVGTKLPRDFTKPLAPTALIETSPGNFQAWYFLAQPEHDAERFSSVINGFIDLVGGVDPGFKGVNRVGRLPEGINGKAKYGGAFRHRVEVWAPRRRFTLQQLCEAFGVQPRLERGRDNRLVAPETMRERIDAFKQLWTWLRSRGMLLKAEPDAGGAVPVVCPWEHLHSERSRTGTYLKLPCPENEWRGGFICWHTSAHPEPHLHLRDLARWAEGQQDEETVEQLDRANKDDWLWMQHLSKLKKQQQRQSSSSGASRARASSSTIAHRKSSGTRPR